VKYGYQQERWLKYEKVLKKWNRLWALLVVQDDQLLVEKYFGGATKYSTFNVHSVTKSITSALVGLAIQRQDINSEHDLMVPCFPEYQPSIIHGYKRALTIVHLLAMRGGWGGEGGIQTVARCLTQEPLRVLPGTEFKYFTGSQNILSAIITKKTHMSTKEFADKALFQPLGIKNTFWFAANRSNKA